MTEITEIQSIVDQFCNQLRQSIQRATTSTTSPPPCAAPMQRPVTVQTPLQPSMMSTEQEVRRLFPSINRNMSTTQNMSSMLGNTTRQVIDLFRSNSKKRKRSCKEKFQQYKKDVILLHHPSENKTVTGLKKAETFQHGFGKLSVPFEKYWSKQEVFDHITQLFSEKLNGTKFEILVPMHGALLNPNLTNGSELDGRTLHELFHQKIIYIRPLTPLQEECFEEELEEFSDTPQCSQERMDSSLNISPQHIENDEEQFERDTMIAILACKEETASEQDVIELTDTQEIVKEPGTLLEIIQNLKIQINDENVIYFNVYRENVISCCLRAMRRKSFSMFSRISVTFTDINEKSEGAADMGGPTREMFRLALKEMKNSRLFEGPENAKNLSLCNDCLENQEYFDAGRLIMLSIIHGGPTPNFFSNTLFECLINDVESVAPGIEEVIDVSVKSDIELVQNSSNLEELQNALSNSNFMNLAGYGFATTFEKKQNIVEGAIKFYVIHRVRSAFDQFLRGLNTHKLFDKMKPFSSDLKHFMCYKENKLTWQVLKSLFIPMLSEEGNNKRRVENEILAFWLDYLHDCEDGSTDVSLKEILCFATGVDSIPPLDFDQQPTLQFLHNDDSPFPKANTCSLVLSLPVIHKTYEQFQFHLNFGFKNGMVFGFA